MSTRNFARPVLLSLAVLVGTLAGPAGQTLAQDKPTVLKLTSNSPPKSPWAVQIERIVNEASQESKGSLKIDPLFFDQHLKVRLPFGCPSKYRDGILGLFHFSSS